MMLFISLPIQEILHRWSSIIQDRNPRDHYVLLLPSPVHLFPNALLILSPPQSPSHLKANELPTTQSELKAIAALPHTGPNLQPPSFTLNKQPAAIGTKMTLYTTAHPKLNFTLLNTRSESANRVMILSRELAPRRMKELLCMAMSEAVERLIETEAVVRAGASLIPSPTKAMMAFCFPSSPVDFPDNF